MLTLHKYILSKFKNPFANSKQVSFARVRSDNDELIRAIDTEYIRHDDNWQLTPAPDTKELETFWNGVERDLEKDPEWIRFSDD